ncbi:MAG: HXXEE domain-containing protein [Paenibacillaceae bacterium]|nr:HXXEE domain-containing protein [Paenibacillaceae bacterium]
MNDIKVMVWLFPILFMFHDFEEIIFMQSWISKNRNYLTHRFPALSKRLSSHFDQITTSAFALGVAEEFFIISIITVVSYVKTNRCGCQNFKSYSCIHWAGYPHRI